MLTDINTVLNKKAQRLLTKYNLLSCYPLLVPNTPPLPNLDVALNKSKREENFVYVTTDLMTLVTIIKNVWSSYPQKWSAPTYHFYVLPKDDKHCSSLTEDETTYLFLFDKDYYRHGEVRLITELLDLISANNKGNVDYYNAPDLYAVSMEYRSLCNKLSSNNQGNNKDKYSQTQLEIHRLIQDRIEKDKVEYGK